MAATYTPSSFFITGSGSFDVINPSDLNNMTGGSSNLTGLIGGRLQLERGLFGPSWSHWVEFDYFTASASASGDDGSFTQNLNYLAILPLGVTYWFSRTAYIDFGISAGFGLGLPPKYTFSSAPSNGSTPTTTNYSGKLAPAYVARLDARFWLSKNFAATLAVGLHGFSSTLSADGGPSVNAALTGLSMIGGLTFAFGGAQGNGRVYVEVIHGKPDVKKKRPPKATLVPSPLPTTAPTPGPTPMLTPTAQPLSAAPLK